MGRLIPPAQASTGTRHVQIAPDEPPPRGAARTGSRRGARPGVLRGREELRARRGGRVGRPVRAVGLAAGGDRATLVRFCRGQDTLSGPSRPEGAGTAPVARRLLRPAGPRKARPETTHDALGHRSRVPSGLLARPGFQARGARAALRARRRSDVDEGRGRPVRIDAPSRDGAVG